MFRPIVRYRKLFISIIIAFCISLSCYLLNNCPYPYLDNLNKYSWFEYIANRISPDKQDRSDVLFINVGYDKDLADVSYNNGSLIGKKAITNRKTLYDFLKIAENTDTYKYIFLDIHFQNDINTPYDSLLFAQIDRMRDISFSKHSDSGNSENVNLNKAKYNDYFSTITSTNFTRYPFLQNGEESVPLHIYLAVDSSHHTIEQHGIFYTSNGHLCQNSPFLLLSDGFSDGHDENGQQNYFDLGPLLLNIYNQTDWKNATKDKIVIVGDFINDTHDTYIGEQPGSYLIYLVYKSLVAGKQFVSWPFTILMFLLYAVISYLILIHKSLNEILPIIKRFHNNLWIFIWNLIGYSTLLYIISIISYSFFNTSYDVFFPSLFFSLLTTFMAYRTLKK